MERRNYSSEFKTEAVKLVENGKSAGEVARDLGLNRELLRRWVAQFGSKPRADGIINPTPDEHAELIRLRRENRILKEERDILKKAVGIFTRELP